ncbi:RNA polymerase II-associated protein 3 [Termitomyces sp. J132]|nr:RNA polymerase II-associated protein 3 [Termitomyces sp. J132]
MPNRGNKRASQAKSQGETNCNNKASSSSGSNTAPPQSAPLTRAALVDLALQRQKKRTDHAAQKKAKSETLKNAGNNLFQGGDYQAAAEAYQEAIDEYGATAVLYSNLAAAYLKLEQYDDAEDAATEALELDPKIIKARYRRGLARKESGQYRAALIDFKAVLEQDSTRTEARHQMTETQFFYDKYGDEFSEVVDTEGLGYGWPYYDDEPMHVSDTESDSSDCGHLGNGVPCRFYNHGGCSRKDNCRYSHAPDNLSERDKLGRNVCLYSLFDSCKFGEAKCVYSHDKTFLPHGWWSHPEYVTLIKEKLDTRETEEQSKYFIVDVLKTLTRPREAAATASLPNVQTSSSRIPFVLVATSDQDEDGNNNIETPSEVKFVLILAFDSDITDEYKEPMINLIKLKSQVKVASTQSEALRLLYSDAITGVFVADAAIANRKNAQMLTKLVEYAKAGGSVVIGGAFSSLVKPKDIGAFFLKSWGVPWKPGSYHRTTFFLNPAHELAKSNPVLAQSYSMKALHLKDISPDVVVYRPTRESRLESLVFPPGPVTNMNESPVVRTRVGKGYLGYIGDVNWEDDSANLVLAMMGLLGPRQSQSQPQAGPSGSAAKVAPSTAKPAPSQPSPVSQAACVPKASTPAPTSTSSSNQKPFTSISKESFLLLLSLEEDDFFATSNAHCLSAIREKVVVSQALTLSTALTKLDDKHLAGVFVTDTGIVKPENKEILPRLLRYVKQGGVVIVGGSFSSFVSASDMDSFFSDTCKSGAYHRTRFLRNGRHDLVTNNPSLSSSYSMKALHLGGLALSDPIYLPADNLQLQTPLPFNDHTESPVVRRKIGDGYFGYVGDVDAEVETTNVVLAMFGLLDELTAQPASAVEEVKKAPELPPPSKQVNEATSKQVPLKQTTQNPVTPAVEVKTNIEVLPEPPREQAPPPSISATVNEAESILITDAAIVDAENAYLLSRLVAFAKAGGIVVMGGSFSSHVKFNQLGTFFQDSWGVPWRSGDYTSCEIAVNTEHELAKSPVLPSAFMMKGLFVSGVTSQTALYVLAEGYATAKTSQAPVASAQVGKGRVGYIGDVGLQDEHSKIVLAMFGLSQ